MFEIISRNLLVEIKIEHMVNEYKDDNSSLVGDGG